jgi:hypothetical protein
MMSQDDPRLVEALRLLVEAAEARARAHPWAHLLRAADARLDLSLRLPLFDAGGDRVDEETRALQGELEDAVAALLSGAAAFQPGRVFCFRCGQAGCAHAATDDPRAVFTGYGPTGTPRFADFFQVLVSRRDPRMETLASGSPDLVVLETSGETLMGELLPVYRQGREDVRVHGQVAAGWYRVPDPSGRPGLLAVTFQVASGRTRGGQRRYFLNIIGAGPGGETLEHLHDRLAPIPWSGAARWAQSALAELERGARRRRQGGGDAVESRIEGLLGGLARRLERGERARERRTRHATVRHEEGSRPTRMAVADAVRAAEDEVLFDVRRGTIVVLGERGRAHVFNQEGKLVTSVRYHPDAISRRRESGVWRPASPAEIELVKNRTAAPRRDGTG